MMVYGAYEKYDDVELLGRKRIYTDAEKITVDNIFNILSEAIVIHENNARQIEWLLRYEKGIQPLGRKKTKRPDINIEVADNLANQIVEFKLGYHYGNPITFVQRSNKDMSGNSPDSDDSAITQLNEMNDAEYAYAKDQAMARFIQICGIGYEMVDTKRRYNGASVFDLYAPHPMYTFIVYRNNLAETPMLGVTYRILESGDRYFSCWSDDTQYEVKNEVQIINGVKRENWSFRSPYVGYAGEKNPLGMVPIVEFNRAYDRMGVFERQISDMDALNIEVSDFANAVSQDCQALWWGNDFEFPKDENGKEITPKSNQWIITRTKADGKQPLIQAIQNNFDYTGVQENIVSKRNSILQKCFVPLQSDPGGGSTANALSLSSGWTAAEAAAQKEEQIIRESKMRIVELELAAIADRASWIPDSPLLKLKASDVYCKFTRQKTYDLGTKTNAMVAMIKSGVNGRIAMQTVDLFADVAQAWSDSKDMIEKMQKSLFDKPDPVPVNEKRETSDLTDQAGNSPIIDGMRTETTTVTEQTTTGGDANA